MRGEHGLVALSRRIRSHLGASAGLALGHAHRRAPRIEARHCSRGRRSWRRAPYLWARCSHGRKYGPSTRRARVGWGGRVSDAGRHYITREGAKRLQEELTDLKWKLRPK